MFFDSTIYLVFLALTVFVYWRLPFRPQNYFLLAASYFFYGWWDWRFLGLMAGSTLLDFAIAKRIHASNDDAARKRLLILSLAANFSVLGFFKYFNFFIDSFAHVASTLGLEGVPTSLWKIVLPPAISFYTFQEVAYIVDVYKRKITPTASVADYALFVSLFPHLIAGPIQQPSHLLPQVERPRSWDTTKAFDGVLLILEGLFRKVVIADNCALIANAAFGGSFGEPSFWVLLLGVYAFAFQIYGDFSGYSSIARGSAQLLGFHFMVNFRQPYLSQSLQDFWRRWHISLSSWLRDYLYIPLGGSKTNRSRTYLNLMLTMLLGGLWHGANWTFVIWGAIHGTGLAIERFFAEGGRRTTPRSLVARWIARILVFNIVCLAWVFFRSDSVSDAFLQLYGVATIHWDPVYAIAAQFLLAFVIVMIMMDLQLERSGAEYLFGEKSLPVRVMTGLGLCALITLFGANQLNAFIYFQF